MNHLDFLNLADELKTAHDEAKLRSSVSRAYYAVYHHIRSYLVENNIVAQKARLPHNMVHIFLFECAKYSGRQELEKLSRKVEAMKVNRERADYRVDLTTFNIKTCETIVCDCHRIIRDFDSNKGQELINGIRAYLTQSHFPIPYRP